MVVMSSVLYYVLPGLLGRAYDMKNGSMGPDLFTKENTDKAWVLQKYMTNCEYKLVSELSEAVDFLDVSGDLSIAIKSGNVKLDGAGSYIKDIKSFEKTMDLLVKVDYTTVCYMLPSDIKPMSEWPTMLKDSGMTHYVRTICYGGQLIASLRFTTKNEQDKEVIKGALGGSIGSDSGSFGGGLKGGLEKAREKIGDTASMEINYFATVPLDNEIPRTLDGLIDIVNKFPEAAKSVNDGFGVPISMEVFSLTGLDKNIRTYWQTLALQDQMMVFDEYYTDIRQTKPRLSDWLKTMPPNLPREQMDKIGEFATKLENIERVFSETVANLNLSAEADGEQFKPAFDAYQGDREEVIPNMYLKDLSRLKKEILDGTPSLEGDYGGAHYTHWGADTCPDQTTLVFSGITSTTDSSGVGASQLTCLPNEKQFPTAKTQAGDDIEDYPEIQQVAFVSRKKDGDKKKKTITCTSCRVPGKSVVTTLYAVAECPSGWNKMYAGTAVSTDYQQVRGELVCLDTSQSFQDVSDDNGYLTVVTEVSPKCGSYPCSGGLAATTAIPCVVCSRTKESTSIADFIAL